MNLTHVTIIEATAGNLNTIHTLLAHASLGNNDVLAPGTRYWLALDAEGVPIGTIGVEYGADTVLVRSAAVHTRARSRGVGTALLTHALAEVQRMGYNRAYLFSTDAGAYWLRQGFHEVPVPELVATLPAAPQVLYYAAQGWLPTEVAWRRDLAELR